MIVLCCTTKCWPVTYICSDYTYVPVPPHKKKKKEETVTTRIQNNEVITIRKSHTHTHTYIYIRVYICRLCDVFQSGESDPLKRIANESITIDETEIRSPAKCRISNFFRSIERVFLSFKKSNNYVLSGGA